MHPRISLHHPLTCVDSFWSGTKPSHSVSDQIRSDYYQGAIPAWSLYKMVRYLPDGILSGKGVMGGDIRVHPTARSMIVT